MRIKNYGDEIRLDYCPVCQKEKKDNPCFSVNAKTGLYMCHSSNKSGHISEFPDLKKELNINFEDNKAIKKEKEIYDFKELVLSSKPLNDKWYEYLKSRRIENCENINKIARLGAYESMMIPITDGEKVVGIKYRSFEKKLWSEKGSCLEYFINWQNVNNFDYVVIVEGEIDLLSALESGVNNCVSLPSGANNLKCVENQKEWLSNFEKIIIATDDDMAGAEAQKRIIGILSDLFIPLYKTYFYKKKDINEVLTKSGKEKVYEYLIENCSRIKTGYKAFQEKKGCYFYTSEEKTEKITDFIVNVNSYSENYLIGESLSAGRSKEFKAKISELLSVRGMADHMGLFLGSSNLIPKFIDFLKSENTEKYVQEIKYYGLMFDVNNDSEKMVYYDKESEIICDKRDLKITCQSEIDFLNEEEKKWLEKNLIYMRRDPNQSLLGICWALGRFHNLGSYPILEAAGTTSIGKTEFVEFISRILFGGKENIKSLSTLSNHQIRSFSSCSNITPWVIDEVKISGKYQLEKTTELYSTIRAVYDNKVLNQGNTTNKLTEFYLCTPLIISGETELCDVSIKNRMISTRLTKANKGDFEIFKFLKKTDILEKLGKEVLNYRLKYGEISIDDSVISIKDERQKYNASCLLKGLKALSKVVKIDDGIIKNFIKYINDNFSKEFSVADNFKKLLELARNSGIENLEEIYKCNKVEHWARFQQLYKVIAEEKAKTNSTFELLDMGTLRKQLIEENFITKNSVLKRVKIRNAMGIEETKPMKVVEFEIIDND